MLIGVIILSYLLGSIPSGVIVGKIKGRNIRNLGSGNIGTANVARVFGIPMAIVVLIGDALKGLVAVLVGRWLGASSAAAVLAGIAAVCGHNWSLFLGFKGGKGVATSFGVCLAISPLWGVLLAGVWVITVAVTRYSSAGSLMAAIAAPVVAVILRLGWGAFFFGVIGAILIIIRHKANIERLRSGTELRLGDRI